MDQGDAADGQVEVGHLGAKLSKVPRDVLELTEYWTGMCWTGLESGTKLTTGDGCSGCLGSYTGKSEI